MSVAIDSVPPLVDVVTPYLSAFESAVSLVAGSATLLALTVVSYLRWRRDERAAAARQQAMLSGTPSDDPALTRRGDSPYWQAWTWVGAAVLVVTQIVFVVGPAQLLVAGECVAGTITSVTEYPDYKISTRRRSQPRVIGTVMRYDLEAKAEAACDGSPLSGRLAGLRLRARDISAEDNRLVTGQVVPFVVSPWWTRVQVVGSDAGMRAGPRALYLSVAIGLAAAWIADPRRLRVLINRAAGS